MQVALYQVNEGKHNLVRDDEFRCLSNTKLSRKSSLHIRQKRCQFPGSARVEFESITCQ